MSLLNCQISGIYMIKHVTNSLYLNLTRSRISEYFTFTNLILYSRRVLSMGLMFVWKYLTEYKESPSILKCRALINPEVPTSAPLPLDCIVQLSHIGIMDN